MNVHPLKLSGAEFIPDPSGALIWPAEETIVVADLHFEKGSSFASRGVLFPPYDTCATLDRLEGVMKRVRPKRVIALGDSFHDRFAGERFDSVQADRLVRAVENCDWIWIAGNHDPRPPSFVKGTVVSSYRAGGLVFRHVPASRADAEGEIAGHLHPAARVNVQGMSFRRRCFVSDGRRAILPAFGAFTGGLDLDTPAFDGLFGAALTAWLLGERGTYAFQIRRNHPAHVTSR